jgi:hypothetical protein
MLEDSDGNCTGAAGVDGRSSSAIGQVSIQQSKGTPAQDKKGIPERGKDAADELRDEIVTSAQLGLYGEEVVTSKLEDEGYINVDRNLYMITTDGRVRIADIAAMKDGHLTLVEVKVNTSPYKSDQRRKDALIAREGAWVNPQSPAAKRIWGTDIPLPYIDPTPTKVVRVSCSFAGWKCR